MIRPWGAVMAAALLAGCVAGSGGEVPRQPGDAARRLFSMADLSGAGQRLIPFTTLDGYLRASGSGRSAMMRFLTGATEARNTLYNPVALDAGDNGVYVIDGGTQALYRFRWEIDDPGHASPEHREAAHGGLSHADWTRLAVLRDLEDPSDLYVAPNGDLYVSDRAGARVVRLDADGNRLGVFKSKHLKSPVSVAVDRRGLRVFVADGLYDRIVVFNAQGRALYSFGRRGDKAGQFRNIRDMAQGANGLLYVIDGIGRQIQVYGLDGMFIGAFGKGTLTDPGGLAVDGDGRVYVSDRLNQRIAIFEDGELIEMYGAYGTGPGQFSQPGALAHHGGRLYVAERQNARIQVFRTVPEAMAASAS